MGDITLIFEPFLLIDEEERFIRKKTPIYL